MTEYTDHDFTNRIERNYPALYDWIKRHYNVVNESVFRSAVGHIARHLHVDLGSLITLVEWLQEGKQSIKPGECYERDGYYPILTSKNAKHASLDLENAQLVKLDQVQIEALRYLRDTFDVRGSGGYKAGFLYDGNGKEQRETEIPAMDEAAKARGLTFS